MQLVVKHGALHLGTALLGGLVGGGRRVGLDCDGCPVLGDGEAVGQEGSRRGKVGDPVRAVAQNGTAFDGTEAHLVLNKGRVVREHQPQLGAAKDEQSIFSV